MILYAIFRVLCWVTLPIYYKRIRVIGKEHLTDQGPLIVVSNHPNTLMDVLQAGIHLKQRLGFLANAGIFKNPMAARLWRYLQVIPIYRQQDLARGERMDNSSSFRACFEFLGRGKTLMILPEGSSYSEMKLRTIKSGTARIALDFLDQAPESQELRIQPTSLNYSDPIQFRSKLIKAYNAPIKVSDYLELYREHPRKAVRQLSEEIRKRLAANMVILNDKKREQLFRYLRVLFRDYLQKNPADTSAEGELRRRQELATAIQSLADADDAQFKEILKKTGGYFKQLNKAGLRDGMVKAPKRNWWAFSMLSSLLLLVLFPVFVAGTLIAGPLLGVPAFLVPKLTKEFEYHAVMKLIMGWLLFPIWSGIVFVIAYFVGGLDAGWSLLLIPGGPILGGLAWGWYQCWLRNKSFWKAALNGSAIQSLKTQRDQLLEEVRRAMPEVEAM